MLGEVRREMGVAYHCRQSRWAGLPLVRTGVEIYGRETAGRHGDTRSRYSEVEGRQQRCVKHRSRLLRMQHAALADLGMRGPSDGSANGGASLFVARCGVDLKHLTSNGNVRCNKMTFRHTYESVRQARDGLRQRRLEREAVAEQAKRDADALFLLESDMTRLLDSMQLRSRFHAETEARQ